MSSSQELIENADNAYYATEYDKAIDLYKQALDLDSDNKHAQEQIAKAELYRSFKSVKLEDLMAEALQLYKRSRSFIAIGDLDGAKTLLQLAITVAEKAGMDFTNAKALLENIQNAIMAEEYKKKAYDELEKQQWVKAESNLSIAIDLDPTDYIIQTLLPHLRSLLKAQNLMLQLNSGFGSARNRSKINREVEEIFMRTNETPILNAFWQELVSRHQKIAKTNDVRKNNLLENFFRTKKNISKTETYIPKIFISYSHKDEIHKDELVTMLAGLQRRGIIDAWQDRRIEAGEEWFDAIRKAMEECNMAILLMSPDFVASSFIQTEELKFLFQRRIEEGLRVAPIIVRQCLWQSEPVIKDLQALPKDGKPVISFSKENGDRDQVWSEIGKAIESIAKSL